MLQMHEFGLTSQCSSFMLHASCEHQPAKHAGCRAPLWRAAGRVGCLQGQEVRVSCCNCAVSQHYVPAMDGMEHIHSIACWVCGGLNWFDTLGSDSALALPPFLPTSNERNETGLSDVFLTACCAGCCGPLSPFSRALARIVKQ